MLVLSVPDIQPQYSRTADRYLRVPTVTRGKSSLATRLLLRAISSRGRVSFFLSRKLKNERSSGGDSVSALGPVVHQLRRLHSFEENKRSLLSLSLARAVSPFAVFFRAHKISSNVFLILFMGRLVRALRAVSRANPGFSINLPRWSPAFRKDAGIVGNLGRVVAARHLARRCFFVE